VEYSLGAGVEIENIAHEKYKAGVQPGEFTTGNGAVLA